MLESLIAKPDETGDGPMVVEDEDEILKSLPCYKPRIAIRDIARTDDTRTVTACLIMSKTMLTPEARYLKVNSDLPESDEENSFSSARNEAFVLGIISSMVLDWYVRTYVELHVTGGIISGFPIPDLEQRSRIRKEIERNAAELSCAQFPKREDLIYWAKEVGLDQ